MALAFRLCLALLGLMSFLLSPVSPLAVDVQSDFPNEPESNSIFISGTDENHWPAVQPIDPPDPAVPTKVPVPTGTPFIIDTRLVVKVNTGQPFIIKLDKFLQIFRDGVKLSTDPKVSWVSLDSTHRAVIGRVPKDYPTSRILIYIAGPYSFNGRVINLGYVVALDHVSLAVDTLAHEPSHHDSTNNSSQVYSRNDYSHINFSHNNSSHNDCSHNSWHTDDAADHREDESEWFTKSDLVPEREVHYPLRPVQIVTRGHRYFVFDGAAVRMASP
ncbi:hypothetical protein INS49_009076 [Diaporthe citri]|uniref:uncharacterized protein n=1 Tax=Diaporthe citri TaxID=83186 RepID=UPI001C7F99E3|nr:uncharacterized protein INS49_009076 [Diaporthe citri]KAG6363973.1 hypothetical protein INS49_009076 [Diaporthe citri]